MGRRSPRLRVDRRRTIFRVASTDRNQISGLSTSHNRTSWALGDNPPCVGTTAACGQVRSPDTSRLVGLMLLCSPGNRGYPLSSGLMMRPCSTKITSVPSAGDPTTVALLWGDLIIQAYNGDRPHRLQRDEGRSRGNYAVVCRQPQTISKRPKSWSLMAAPCCAGPAASGSCCRGSYNTPQVRFVDTLSHSPGLPVFSPPCSPNARFWVT